MRYLAVLVFCFTAQKIISQEFYSNIIRDFEFKVTSMIEEKNFISSNSMRASFKQAINNKINLIVENNNHKKLTASELYDEYKNSVVVVGNAYYCNHCPNIHLLCSSGYFISKEGYFITNNHVAQICTNNKTHSTFAYLYNGQVFPVEKIVCRDSIHDLAILKIRTKNYKIKPFSINFNPQIGDQIYSIHHPKGLYYYLSEGIITAKYNYENNESSRFVINSEFAEGSSGGPIIDKYGNVVATISSSKAIYKEENNYLTPIQMVNYNCIPSRFIKKFINN